MPGTDFKALQRRLQELKDSRSILMAQRGRFPPDSPDYIQASEGLDHVEQEIREIETLLRFRQTSPASFTQASVLAEVRTTVDRIVRLIDGDDDYGIVGIREQIERLRQDVHDLGNRLQGHGARGNRLEEKVHRSFIIVWSAISFLFLMMSYLYIVIWGVR